MSHYLLAIGVVFAINLLPAFGPPTWAVLVFFRLQSSLAPVPLIALGAVAAALGRLVLANASRRLRGRLGDRHLGNLDAAESALAGNRRRSIAGLALFAISPIPSAQMFVAAGLMRVPLMPLTAAFFAGRLVSYSIYVSAAGLASHSLGSLMTQALTSPLGIALQVLAVAAIVALVRVDWLALLGKRSHRAPPPSA